MREIEVSDHRTMVKRLESQVSSLRVEKDRLKLGSKLRSFLDQVPINPSVPDAPNWAHFDKRLRETGRSWKVVCIVKISGLCFLFESGTHKSKK